MTSGAECLYCGNQFDPNRGEGDHIIPAQFGEFRNDVRFRRVCPPCNSRIGQAEQQMVQSSSLGFYRNIIKPQSRRLKKRGIGRPRGAMGAPPPKYMVNTGNHYALVELSADNPREVVLVDYILVRDKEGKEAHIRLYPNIRAKQIESALSKTGLGEMEKCWLSCSEKHETEYANLLRRIWPGLKLEWGEPTLTGVYPSVPGRAEFQMNMHYFRAIAKIAFHYYLTHTRRGYRGNEDFFADIRHFILHGGDQDLFFNQNKRPRFVIPFGELPTGGAITPSQWSHVLAASEANGQAVVYVHLFVGPEGIRPPHYVSLGQWNSPIIEPNNAWGHVYLYDNSQQNGNTAGYVERAQISVFGKFSF